ncbi:hypothetical protein SAMN05421823_101536 [Catalinimonas alkaloidigena]|uniref:Pre-peptidase C-terminal domain-containing protein n=1 Tax=Catalinimonas alkaloidigena TaxID=1075417 RepID=A0A1G8Y0T8_9BACT|nr:hypothetical protein [Catalinimonas alkaloidigena]SDJ96418.1 hypothetical protein SAMN05421823_101536 [Catalinimonas alkaloidigena]
MKKYIFAVCLSMCAFLMADQAQAQCDVNKFLDNCNGKLASGYTFLKSYSVNGESGGKVEHSYVFSKDTNYLITLCSENGDTDGMVVTLYDSNRKQLISSHDAKSGRFLPAIGIRISATGIYYLAFSFEGDGPKCGGSVVGFKR